MLLKTSTLFVILGLMLFSQSSSFQIKELFNKVAPTPVQCFFHSKGNCKNESGKNEEYNKKEHGSLDFFGRSIIKNISRKIGEIRDEIQITISNVTTGLDCNFTLSDGGMLDSFKNKIKAIYPGTKWCGDGNVSRSYDDLGTFADTDSCCREHDMCPDNISADETKHGLVNTGLFTRSHCDCDRKFYECLKNVDGSLSAKSIGVTYFTILGPQCFQEDYPIVSCEETESQKCIRYKQNTRESKKYQWFDSPTF